MDTRKRNKRTTKRRRHKTKTPASPERPAREDDPVLNRPRKAHGVLYIPHDLPDERECQETNVQNSQDPDEENIVLPEFKRKRIVPIFPPRAKEARRLPPPIPKFDIKPKGSKVQQQEVAEKEAPSSNQPGGLQQLLEAYGSEDESEEEKALNEYSVSTLKALQVYYASDDSQD